jgi:hypothetical protein
MRCGVANTLLKNDHFQKPYFESGKFRNSTVYSNSQTSRLLLEVMLLMQFLLDSHSNFQNPIITSLVYGA